MCLVTNQNSKPVSTSDFIFDHFGWYIAAILAASVANFVWSITH